MTTKPTNQLTLKDRLSRLTFHQACKVLGEDGKTLIQKGGKYDVNITDAHLRGDRFEVQFPSESIGQTPIVSITLQNKAKERLGWKCTTCNTPCEHVGAAISLILEEKISLGLAAPPKERIPMESLSEDELVRQAVADRRKRAKDEKFRLVSTNPKKAWTDYTLTSAESGKSYHLTIRGTECGDSYCSCPDFRTNTLGTCKHLIYALQRVKAKFPADARRDYEHKHYTVHVQYTGQISLRLSTPARPTDESLKIAQPMLNKEIEDVPTLVRTIAKLEKAGYPVSIYPDARELIDQQLFHRRMETLVREIRKDPSEHPLRKSLLKTELLPYQLDGIAFAAGAGRAVLADDMGLGKTIQGIGVAELLAQQADLRKVLIICPTSLKSQWRNEINKFSCRDCQLILGSASQRAEQYDNDAFFTICNYEQVLRDLQSIELVKWDLIILDEGQRIKNWEAKTSAVVKSLKSPFALVLSGTPLENRLDELYNVVQFVDDRRLGPGFRFFNQHRVVDEKGKVLGYKNLEQLRNTLTPILLRRTRAQVLNELPPRTTEIILIPPTEEQQEINATHMRIVAHIVRKAYINEMDLLRLRQALLTCRLAADSTYLVNKLEPGHSTKLERLGELLEQLFVDPTRKIVLFSEWTTMLNLIEGILKKQKLKFVRLDGSVPQKKRLSIVNEFQDDPTCQLFLTTNAGSVGLNLQAANTVINVDLPWNPAVLEQRIARAHRMGQKNPVQVYLLVTESTLEQNLLITLQDKQKLALAALDIESDIDELDMVSGIDDIRRRLEILLGAKPEAPIDESKMQEAKLSATSTRETRIASAGGEMLGAVFNFLGELINDSDDQDAKAAPEVVNRLRENLISCTKEDNQGRQQLTVTLPSRESLDNLATTLAKLMASNGNG